MKFEIDLNDIMGDEYGNAETLGESVRRQVVEKLTKTVSEGVRTQVDAEVARVLKEEVKAAVAAKMPALIDDLLNVEYIPVDRYGTKQEPTTIRNQLVKKVVEQMEYKGDSYRSDRNVFTEGVNKVVAETVATMQKEFDRKVVELFQKQAFEYAMTQMAKKLEVKLTAADLAKE